MPAGGPGTAAGGVDHRWPRCDGPSVSHPEPTHQGGAMMPAKSATPALGEPRYWADLAAASDRDDAREQIRLAIHAGTIRVRPWPGYPARVRIVSSADGNARSF